MKTTPSRACLILAVFALLAACRSPAGPGGVWKSSAAERAQRRAYDGAPPVIPHQNFGMTCTSCHNRRGIEIEGVGFAPPTPHEKTLGMSAVSRCRQCHVFAETAALLVDNRFVGLRQDLRRGRRLNPLAPPTIPHKTFMRENCLACHTGPAAREEIRTTHPERTRCRQCHVPVTTTATFRR
ncbi:MAG: nitrate reductase cytochrome c-type subunit [Terriglobia bacterium]